MVAAAVDELPGWVHETMDNVEILIDDEPPDDEPGELLGLYQGVPLTERGDDYGALPDTITLFLGSHRTRGEGDGHVTCRGDRPDPSSRGGAPFRHR